MNLKELSHSKYNELKDEEKKTMREWAISQLPSILKTNESAIMNKIYMYIRLKINK